mgnify:CR=1 FL=1
MVTMLNMSVASPRRRHWRDAASATRQAKSGDGGHDLSECQAPEVRWALFPTKSVVAPDSNLFVPVLTTSVLMLLPPLQGTSTGAARSMPGLRAAEDASSWLLAHRRSFCFSLASRQLSDLRTTRTVRTRSYKHERPWMWRARCTIRRRRLIIIPERDLSKNGGQLPVLL